MRRRKFLEEFLGALGVIRIDWKGESEKSISGTVIYELNDPEEMQDFIWHIEESNAPKEEIHILAALLNEQKLLDVDKIKVSRRELIKSYCEKVGRVIPESEFVGILEALESISVPMVDEGEETDIFFIHE